MYLLINCVLVNILKSFRFEPVMNYHLSRRYFLKASTAIALNQMLMGCSNAETMLQVLFLENSIPPQLIRDFRKAINNQKKVNFKPQTQIPQIFDSLLNLQQSKKSDQKTKNIISKIFSKSVIYPALTSLGDVWLGSAIKQNLIKPLSVNNLKNWQELPPLWQKLGQRDRQGNVTTEGKIYGAPYRWGSIVIAYRSDKLEQLNLTDWGDFWHPELRDRISLLDSPREVIGLTLKKLGKSYNISDLDADPKFKAKLEEELLALHQQAKRYGGIKFIIPASGVSLWADLWVKPKEDLGSLVVDKEDKPTAIEEWIDYCWESQGAKQISLFTNGISPILSTLPSAEIPADLQENVFLNSAILKSDKSEFLLPLNPKTAQQYRDLWLKIRSS